MALPPPTVSVADLRASVESLPRNSNSAFLSHRGGPNAGLAAAPSTTTDSSSSPSTFAQRLAHHHSSTPTSTQHHGANSPHDHGDHGDGMTAPRRAAGDLLPATDKRQVEPMSGSYEEDRPTTAFDIKAAVTEQFRRSVEKPTTQTTHAAQQSTTAAPSSVHPAMEDFSAVTAATDDTVSFADVHKKLFAHSSEAGAGATTDATAVAASTGGRVVGVTGGPHQGVFVRLPDEKSPASDHHARTTSDPRQVVEMPSSSAASRPTVSSAAPTTAAAAKTAEDGYSLQDLVRKVNQLYQQVNEDDPHAVSEALARDDDSYGIPNHHDVSPGRYGASGRAVTASPENDLGISPERPAPPQRVSTHAPLPQATLDATPPGKSPGKSPAKSPSPTFNTGPLGPLSDHGQGTNADGGVKRQVSSMRPPLAPAAAQTNRTPSASDPADMRAVQFVGQDDDEEDAAASAYRPGAYSANPAGASNSGDAPKARHATASVDDSPRRVARLQDDDYDDGAEISTADLIAKAYRNAEASAAAVHHSADHDDRHRHRDVNDHRFQQDDADQHHALGRELHVSRSAAPTTLSHVKKTVVGSAVGGSTTPRGRASAGGAASASSPSSPKPTTRRPWGYNASNTTPPRGSSASVDHETSSVGVGAASVPRGSSVGSRGQSPSSGGVATSNFARTPSHGSYGPKSSAVRGNTAATASASKARVTPTRGASTPPSSARSGSARSTARGSSPSPSTEPRRGTAPTQTRSKSKSNEEKNITPRTAGRPATPRDMAPQATRIVSDVAPASGAAASHRVLPGYGRFVPACVGVTEVSPSTADQTFHSSADESVEGDANENDRHDGHRGEPTHFAANGSSPRGHMKQSTTAAAAAKASPHFAANGSSSRGVHMKQSTTSAAAAAAASKASPSPSKFGFGSSASRPTASSSSANGGTPRRAASASPSPRGVRGAQVNGGGVTPTTSGSESHAPKLGVMAHREKAAAADHRRDMETQKLRDEKAVLEGRVFDLEAKVERQSTDADASRARMGALEARFDADAAASRAQIRRLEEQTQQLGSQLQYALTWIHQLQAKQQQSAPHPAQQHPHHQAPVTAPPAPSTAPPVQIQVHHKPRVDTAPAAGVASAPSATTTSTTSTTAPAASAVSTTGGQHHQQAVFQHQHQHQQQQVSRHQQDHHASQEHGALPTPERLSEILPCRDPGATMSGIGFSVDESTVRRLDMSDAPDMTSQRLPPFPPLSLKHV